MVGRMSARPPSPSATGPAMNTDRLAKHYRSLTPAERLPLILAAWYRGDKQEWERLHSSAPRLAYSVADHFRLAMAHRDLGHWHRLEVLDLAALFFHSHGLSGTTKGEEGRRLLACAKVFGHLLKVKREGWRQFCEGMNIDPDFCQSSLPGHEALGLAADLAERVAFTAEGTLQFMRQEDETATASPTAEGVAAGLRKALDVRADWWG
jgi:hypothetical protein